MLRKVITPVPTYSEEERDVVYAAIVFVVSFSLKTVLMSSSTQPPTADVIGIKPEDRFHGSWKRMYLVHWMSASKERQREKSTHTHLKVSIRKLSRKKV